MSEDVKVNHVLEHGTIYFLKELHGERKRIGGSALTDGFRIHGKVSPEDVHQAFGKFREALRNKSKAIAISDFCGSRIPALQGFSLLLLTLTVAAFGVLELDRISILTILLINLTVFFISKRFLSRWFQKKYTLSFDFKEAEIFSINKVKKKGILENATVYFIKTRILN
ncbi:MAG: DUF6391 domain-containing protein [bacterium]